jgi:hypothetical protein
MLQSVSFLRLKAAYLKQVYINHVKEANAESVHVRLINKEMGT